MAVQLVDHLLANGLMDTFQSAYREGHSTETALLRVQNDILMEHDKGNEVIPLIQLTMKFYSIGYQQDVTLGEQHLNGFIHI